MGEVTPESPAATALDVAHEVTGLIVACLHAARLVDGGNHPSWEPEVVPTSRKVVEAETRLAVAMESWLGEGMTFTAAETVRQLGDLLGPVHDQLHEEK